MTVTDLPAVSDDEIRQWAKATGRQVSDRGRISAELRAEYTRMADAADTALPGGEPAPGPRDDGPQRAAREETRPRKVTSRKGWRDKLWGQQGTGQGRPRAKAKPKHPRVSLDRFIERGWSTLARIAQPVNLPVSRVLAFQAPVAGVMLEDVVKGTVVDLILQPIARTEAKLEIAGALAGPPLLVLALQLPHNQPFHPDGSPSPAGAIRHAVLMSALEEALMMWDDVTRSRMAEVQERIAANEAARVEVQKLIAAIFEPTAEQAAARAENEAVARARQRP